MYRRRVLQSAILQPRKENVDPDRANQLFSFCKPAITATAACCCPTTGGNRPQTAAPTSSIAIATDVIAAERAQTSPSALRRMRPHPPATRRCEATPRPSTAACCLKIPAAMQTPPRATIDEAIAAAAGESRPAVASAAEVRASADEPPATAELCGVREHIGAVLALVAQVLPPPSPPSPPPGGDSPPTEVRIRRRCKEVRFRLAPGR